MSAAEKLAQVIREELVGTVGECVCDEAFTSRNLRDPQCSWHNTDGDNLPAELAAVVLAHLTSEGWAQGREEWGLQYERQADPTMDNPSGVVTNTMTLRDESQARGVLDSPAPISARNKRVVRRYVTDWEPVETGDQE